MELELVIIINFYLWMCNITIFLIKILFLKFRQVSGRSTARVLGYLQQVRFSMEISNMWLVSSPLLVVCLTILGFSTWEIFLWTREICGQSELIMLTGHNSGVLISLSSLLSLTTTIILDSSPIRSSETETEISASYFLKVTPHSL